MFERCVYNTKAGVYKVANPPPRAGDEILSSCWGRKLSGEEGNGKREGEKRREVEAQK